MLCCCANDFTVVNPAHRKQIKTSLKSNSKTRYWEKKKKCVSSSKINFKVRILAQHNFRTNGNSEHFSRHNGSSSIEVQKCCTNPWRKINLLEQSIKTTRSWKSLYKKCLVQELWVLWRSVLQRPLKILWLETDLFSVQIQFFMRLYKLKRDWVEPLSNSPSVPPFFVHYSQ